VTQKYADNMTDLAWLVFHQGADESIVLGVDWTERYEIRAAYNRDQSMKL